MLSARDVETAFVETARRQVNGEEFNWKRCADLLNEQLRTRAPLFSWARRP